MPLSPTSNLVSLPRIPSVSSSSTDISVQQAKALLRSYGWLQAVDVSNTFYGDTAQVSGIATISGGFATQSDSAKRPIALSGGLKFDGLNDAIPVNMSSITAYSKVTMYAVYSAAPASTGVIMETTNQAYNQNGLASFLFSGGAPGALSGSATLSNYKSLAQKVDGFTHVYASTHNRDAAAAAEVFMYLNGELDLDYDTTRDVDTSGNFAVLTGSWIGARNNGANSPLDGCISFVGVRPNIDSPETIRQISRMLKVVFGCDGG